MLTLEGTYNNGYIELPENPVINRPVRVLITFLDDVELPKKRKLSRRFSFQKSRALFKNCTTSLSQAVIEERREYL